MIVLAIDTSTDGVSVAVSNSKQLLASSHVLSDRRHAEQLAPIIKNVCEQADISMREIDVVGVDIGPGLFTGMRVGIASAKTIAQVLDGDNRRASWRTLLGDVSQRRWLEH
jgi:tRNA threonylcarbamoyladenosine biosynthesis protein TsaB